MDPSSHQGVFLWDSSGKIPEEPKGSSPDDHGYNLTCCPASSSLKDELHNSMVAAAKAAPNLSHLQQGLPRLVAWSQAAHHSLGGILLY